MKEWFLYLWRISNYFERSSLSGLTQDQGGVAELVLRQRTRNKFRYSYD